MAKSQASEWAWSFQTPSDAGKTEAGRLALKLVSTVAPLGAMGVELGNVPQEAILVGSLPQDLGQEKDTEQAHALGTSGAENNEERESGLEKAGETAGGLGLEGLGKGQPPPALAKRTCRSALGLTSPLFWLGWRQAWL